MPPQEKKISILMTGGQDNRTQEEFVAPVLQQGAGPALRASTNVRLTVKPGTCVRSPGLTTDPDPPTTATAERWGLIPSLSARRCAAQDISYHYVLRGSSTSAPAGAFTPPLVHVESAGGLDGADCVTAPAVSYNAASGLVFRAYMIRNGTSDNIDVAVYSDTGEMVVALTNVIQVFPYPANPATEWVGMTSHGASGDRVWYVRDAVGLCYRSVTVAGASVSAGAEVVVVLPGSLASTIDLASDGGDFAYVAHATAGSVVNATVRKVNVTTGATAASAVIAGALAGTGKSAVQYVLLGGVPRVLVAFSRVTTAKTSCSIFDANLAVVQAAADVNGYGFVTCGVTPASFTTYQATFFVATDSDLSANPTAAVSSTAMGVTFYGAATWPPVQQNWLPYYTLHSHAVQWTRGSYQNAILVLSRSYGAANNLAGQANYVDDPSLAVYAGNFCLARIACVRGGALPAQPFQIAALASRSAVMISGSRLLLTYQKLPSNSILPLSSSGRHAVLNFEPRQPPIAYDKDGSALVAAAQPALYDGRAFRDVGLFPYAPKIATVTSAPGTGTMPAGVYRLQVVHSWTDASGSTHRSRPSNLALVTLALSTTYITVYNPFPTGRAGVDGVTVSVYVSATNGKTMHLKAEVVNYANNGIAIAVTSAGDVAFPQIYSSGSAGEEITPQPPPPLRDISIVGPRCWGIDAEFPTRLVYSKYRVSGIGYEFFPAGEVNLPSGSGDGMAVREWQGLVLCFAERGVYQIAGDGPTNNAGGGNFGNPVKVSDIGCSSTMSVVCFPGGIIWQSGRRFAILTAQGIDYAPRFDCLYDATIGLLLKKYDEILFFSDTTAEIRVYNYAVQKWTTWQIPDPVTCAVVLPWDEDIVLMHSETGTYGTTRRLDAKTASTSAMTWETDWTLLGADFQDHIILRRIIFNGLIGGAHDVTIEVYLDYDTAPTTTRTWTYGELSNIDKAGRYTIEFEPDVQTARAVKFKIYESNVVGDGMLPRSMTIYYAYNGLVYEEALVQGSRK